MNLLVTDVETTSKNKGHPFDPANRLLFFGSYDGTRADIDDIEFHPTPYGTKLESIQERIDSYDVLCGFAFKFDLHWKRRYGIKFRHKRILDLQSAEFILSGQSLKMPSLDDCLAARGLPLKVPFDFNVEHSEAEWREYLGGDLTSEWLLAQAVLEDMEKVSPELRRLIWDDSQDMLMTQEMEYNGIKYDTGKSLRIGDEIREQIADIDKRLRLLVPGDFINWNSGDHLSAILYGGVLKYDERETYSVILKSGVVKTKEHWVTREVVVEQRVAPLEGTELKKQGYFKTDEGTLLKLKAHGDAKTIISLILERSKLEKKVGTYYHGIPSLAKEMGWADDLIHGQLHHCVARTGRLSSSGPNLQNIEDAVRSCIVSRF